MHAWHESDGGWVFETWQEVPKSKFEPNRASSIGGIGNQISTAHAHNWSYELSYKIIMVPKQCPLLRYTFWYLICCAACFGSRDNSKYHTNHLPSHPQTYALHDRDRIFFDCLTPASRLRRSASVWTRDGMPGTVQSGAMPFAVAIFWTKSRLLPVFTCILALSATYFGNFARCALVWSRTPMILCLSNARSWYLHFGISFVALRALVREIIPNTIHTHPHTWPNSDFHRLFDSGFAPSALSLRLN